VSFESDQCTILLFEGQDSAALNYSLNARFGLEGVPFYLTLAGTGPDAAIVPLTAALPAGTSLVLHLRDRSRAVQPASGAAHGEPSRSPTTGGGSRSADAQPLRERAEPLLSPAARGTGAGDSPRRCFSSRTHSTEMCSMTRQDAVQSLAHAVKDVDRMQRLTLDLANERTLLAWTRTSLAAMRTALGFLSPDGEGLVWLGLLLSRCSMVVLCLLAAIFGTLRYSQVKRVTFAPVSGAIRFGRFSMHWFTSFLALACLVMAGCIVEKAVLRGG